MPRYEFEVLVAGAVRIRAANETEARKVVPAVSPTMLMPNWDGADLLPRLISD
jgi:hypothetical protein